MNATEFRIYLDNTPATPEQLDLFTQIRVDQAIGMAAEAQLDLDLALDDNGVWAGMEETFTQPFARVRVEIKLGEGDFVPLIDGPIVAQRFELGAGPGESSLALVVQDDSVLLNQEEKVTLFENMAAHEIAESLFSEFGLTPRVDNTPAAGSAFPRFEVQRGTAMQLLRELARRHGMFLYVAPGAAPGESVGVFEAPDLSADGLPELLLLGEDRNIHKFSAHYDALRPVKARAAGVQISDRSVVTSQTDAPQIEGLGDEPVHSALPQVATILLTHAREEQNDLDAATTAAVDLSTFAYTATAEIDANDYNTVLNPYQVISVAGAGTYLSGDYLISRVTHEINDETYKQTLTLKRNARSGGSGAARSLPSGIL